VEFRGNTYLVQSPQTGMVLSHRLFWVLHRMQAFFAIYEQQAKRNM